MLDKSEYCLLSILTPCYRDVLYLHRCESELAVALIFVNYML